MESKSYHALSSKSRTQNEPQEGDMNQNYDMESQYSHKKSSKARQSEVTIDIHVKHARLKVDDKTPVRVIWSRGKKQAKTQVKVLSASLDKAVFDEKFQINTLLELDEETGMPTREKISKMTIVLDTKYLNNGNKDEKTRIIELAEQELNMADFGQGEYKQVRLKLKKSASNNIIDIDDCFIDLGLKGTRANQAKPAMQPPLVRSQTAKSDNMGSIKGLSQFGNLNRDNFDKISQNSASVVSAAHTQELERVKREAAKAQRAAAKEIAEKKNKINDLETNIHNLDMEIEYEKKQVSKLRKENAQLDENLQSTKQSEQKLTEVVSNQKTKLKEMDETVSCLQLKLREINIEREKQKAAKVIFDRLVRDELKSADEMKKKKEQELVKAQKQLSQAYDSLYDVSNFDTFYLSDLASVLKQKDTKKSAVAPVKADSTAKQKNQIEQKKPAALVKSPPAAAATGKVATKPDKKTQ